MQTNYIKKSGSFNKNILWPVIILTVGIALFHVFGHAQEAPDTLGQQEPSYSIPPEQMERWQAIRQQLHGDEVLCAEHCGDDAACLGNCRKKYLNRLDLEYKKLLEKAVPGPVKPSPEDKCLVCGMFVAKYPDWTGQIIFKDGAVVFFDGSKDLFKYYFNLKEYAPSRTVQDIAALYVTEYYDLTFIDARASVFVGGSDIYGPMGKELIPFRTENDAREFMNDHQGKELYTFDDITPGVIGRLD